MHTIRSLTTVRYYVAAVLSSRYVIAFRRFCASFLTRQCGHFNLVSGTSATIRRCEIRHTA